MEFKSSAITAASKHMYVVFLTRVFPNPKLVFLAIFWYPKPIFFQPPNLGISKKLELMLQSNISNSDNTEVVEWCV